MVWVLILLFCSSSLQWFLPLDCASTFLLFLFLSWKVPMPYNFSSALKETGGSLNVEAETRQWQHFVAVSKFTDIKYWRRSWWIMWESLAESGKYFERGWAFEEQISKDLRMHQLVLTLLVIFSLFYLKLILKLWCMKKHLYEVFWKKKNLTFFIASTGLCLDTYE